ncbi:hypothetical protein L332_11785 [Agrococcus pavilionensis RW1]|uniref:Asparagine synthetase domain-containing protein n=1 Tax=Agrococcus pavilionensis RW1 TaxID=1330458 RepID=U1MT38_9MICO|nr:asparagine synthase-related protein [Agrococcus pavilionensis]ERG65116.1 hypothetical protein L332_11785 [Agrococcus pavilionensis RW1]
MTESAIAARQIWTQHFPQVEEERLTGSMFERMIYARGYLFSDTRLAVVPSHWDKVWFGSKWYLHWDPRLEIGVATQDSTTVLVLGVCLDTDRSISRNDHLARSLVPLVSDSRRFQDRIDQLAGRFLIAVATPQGLLLQADATGQRQLFYSARTLGRFAGSHPRLVAEQAEVVPSAFGAPDFFARNGSDCFPPGATPFEGVRHLSPNLSLQLETGRLERVFPRSDRIDVPAADAAGRLVAAVGAQLPMLAARWPLITSLTGGFDSRITLGLTRHISPQMQYFTFDQLYREKVEVNRHDTATAERLAQDLGLRHTTLRISSPELPAEYTRAVARNSPVSHNRVVSWAYYTSLPKGALHLRSNLYETVRSVFRVNGINHERLGAQSMRAIYSRGRGEDPLVLEAFARFIDETGFSDSHGFDQLDLLHWEYRIGSWLPWVNIESDIAHDVIIPINSRRILRDLLSVPLPDRKSGAAMLIAAHMVWPEVMGYAINGVSRRVPTYSRSVL